MWHPELPEMKAEVVVVALFGFPIHRKRQCSANMKTLKLLMIGLSVALSDPHDAERPLLPACVLWRTARVKGHLEEEDLDMCWAALQTPPLSRHCQQQLCSRQRSGGREPQPQPQTVLLRPLRHPQDVQVSKVRPWMKVETSAGRVTRAERMSGAVGSRAGE